MYFTLYILITHNILVSNGLVLTDQNVLNFDIYFRVSLTLD